MNKPNKPGEDKETKPMNKPSNPSAHDKQCGFGIVELLLVASTLASTVLVAAMNASKRPPLAGD